MELNKYLTEEEKIRDIKSYNTLMAKGLEDKSFFSDRIDAKIFVDFGCADGTLLSYLASKFPDYEYIGYDISGKMIKIAKSKNAENDNMAFTTNWNNIQNYLSKKRKKSALILSSVLHEVYHYSNSKAIANFWNIVFGSKFDYIIIRDLMLSTKSYKKSNDEDVEKVRKLAEPKMLNDFEREHGSIERNKNLIHFLMKYKYKKNWKREVKENYFPMPVEELLSRIPNNYEIIYKDVYTLPYTKQSVKNDFDIDINDTTHIKLILKRK